MTRARDTADTQDNLGGAVAPYVAGKNGVISGGFDVWQRGTTGTANSFSAGAGYNADRWQNYYAGSLTVSRQATSDTTNLPFIQYCARVQRNSGQTNTGGITLGQTFETINSIPFAGKTVTLSYYARAGANYSATSNALGVFCDVGTGTDQNVFFGFSGGTRPLSATTTLTTTWQRFTHTFAVASSTTQIGLLFTENPTGTAGANDYFEVTGVQLEIGAVATPFARAGGSIGGELALCQRYYQSPDTTPTTTMLYGPSSSGGFSANAYSNFTFPVRMRTAPTLTFYAHDGTAGAVSLYVATTPTKSTTVAGIGANPFGWTGNFGNAAWSVNADSGLLAYGYKAEAEL